MSNDLVPDFETPSGFDYLDPREGLADGITAGFSSIGIRGKVWSLRHRGTTYPFVRPDDGTPATFIDIVILGIRKNISKVYFGDWNDDTASGPICASLDAIAPDAGVSIPQSKTCGTCPHNEWGSGSGRGKACQDHKRMAVLLMPEMTKRLLEAPLMEPVFFKVPPGSFKSLKSYDDALIHKGKHYSMVITRMSFDQEKLFQVNFRTMQPLTNREAPLVRQLREDMLTRQIIGTAPVAQIAASAPTQASPVDSGLMEAFGRQTGLQSMQKPAPVNRATPEKPGHRIVEDNGGHKAPEQAAAPAPAPEKEAVSIPWEEGDADLDARVAKALATKMQGMMK